MTEQQGKLSKLTRVDPRRWSMEGTEEHSSSLRRCLIAVLPWAALPLAAFIGLLPFAVFFGSMRHAQGVSPQEANDQLHQAFHLPATAKNVNYSTRVKSSHVTLDLSLDDLRKWCAERKWSIHELPDDHSASFQELNARGYTEVTHLLSEGLEFGDRVGDLGFWGVYDSASGRASVSFTSN